MKIQSNKLLNVRVFTGSMVSGKVDQLENAVKARRLGEEIYDEFLERMESTGGDISGEGEGRKES